MCLNLCFCLRASVFPFNGRCPFSDQCQPSPGFPDHSPGFPDPSPGSPRYLSPHHSSSPFMSSVCPEEGKHWMKLWESMYLWKKETTRLHFSSKLNFPLMDLRKGWRDGSAGKRQGPMEADVQPASWRHGRPQVPQGSSPPTQLAGRCLHPKPITNASLATLRSQDHPALPPTHLWGCRPFLAGSWVQQPSSLTY